MAFDFIITIGEEEISEEQKANLKQAFADARAAAREGRKGVVLCVISEAGSIHPDDWGVVEIEGTFIDHDDALEIKTILDMRIARMIVEQNGGEPA